MTEAELTREKLELINERLELIDEIQTWLVIKGILYLIILGLLIHMFVINYKFGKELKKLNKRTGKL